MNSKLEKAVITFIGSIAVLAYLIFFASIIAGIIILPKIHEQTQELKQQNIELRKVLELKQQSYELREQKLRQRNIELRTQELKGNYHDYS